MNTGPILVIDDEPAIVRFVSAGLRRAGYQAVMAGNGEEALKLGQHGGFVTVP